MKILALEREVPGAVAAAFTPQLLRQEATRVWELQQAGVLREIYFRQDRSDAGLIAFEVMALKPYPGLARLFGEAP